MSEATITTRKPDTIVEFDTCDDPMLAAMTFRHLRDLLNGPDIVDVHADLRIRFGNLTDSQRARLEELQRTMWSLTVRDVERYDDQ